MVSLTISLLGNLLFFCSRLLRFSRLTFLTKYLSGTLSECQMVGIHFRTDVHFVFHLHGSLLVFKFSLLK